MFPWILAVIETKRIHDWKPFLPPWAIAMLALLILLLVFFCYKSETATSSIGTKAMLGLVRLAIFVGVADRHLRTDVVRRHIEYPEVIRGFHD